MELQLIKNFIVNDYWKTSINVYSLEFKGEATEYYVRGIKNNIKISSLIYCGTLEPTELKEVIRLIPYFNE